MLHTLLLIAVMTLALLVLAPGAFFVLVAIVVAALLTDMWLFRRLLNAAYRPPDDFPNHLRSDMDARRAYLAYLDVCMQYSKLPAVTGIETAPFATLRRYLRTLLHGQRWPDLPPRPRFTYVAVTPPQDAV